MASHRRRTPLALALALVVVVAAGLGAYGAEPTPAPTPAPTPVPSPVPTSNPDPPAPDEVGPVQLEPAKLRLRELRGGTSVVKGKGKVFGTRGRIVRYTVEVQTRMPQRVKRALQLEAVTRWAFGDEQRGWTARGERRMQRVGKLGDAKIRIVLAWPSQVDRMCRRGGANTVGKYSCFNGRIAALNNTRWRTGSLARGFASIDQYRLYLVNHEVGHGLGYGHRKCTRKGALGKVMLQQSRSLYGCRANGWPYPFG